MDNSGLTQTLGDKAREGAKWSFIFQFLQKIVFFASSIVLARLLAPADFGLATMSITIDTITWIAVSSGISSALIHFQDNMEERLTSAFWLMIFTMGVFCTLQVIFAPYIAAFYKAPLLKDIINITALSLFINSFGSIHKIILIKNIDFKSTSILEAGMTIGKSILFIVFALAGYGVWSFIYPKVIVAVGYVFALWKMTDWVPEFKLYPKYWGELLKYGNKVLFSNVLDYSINNSSYILIGGMLGSASLGMYTFAYDKSMMVVNNIAYPISMITFPVFSQLQNDHEKLKAAFLKTIKAISIVAFPCAIGQMILGNEYIIAIFGAKWAASVFIFNLILFYSMARSISLCVGPILQGIGKPDILLVFNLIYTPIFILFMYIGCKTGDIYGAGIAAASVGTVATILNVYVVIKILKWKVLDVTSVINPAFVCSLIMGVLLFLIKAGFHLMNMPHVAILLILIPLGTLIYAFAIKIFYEQTFNFVIENSIKIIGKNKGVKNVIADESA